MDKKVWTYVLSFLLLITILCWLALLGSPSDKLKIIACDVGQGDSILIIKKNFQMLVDGGPGAKVSSCLGKYIPFWDRKLEVVVLTHPDADHSTGLVEVLESYKVENFVGNGDDVDTKVYLALKDLIESNKLSLITVKRGDVFKADKINFEILSPDSLQEKTNANSIVIKLTFGEFDALFTGDIEDDISNKLADNYNFNAIEYLKVPHHGSKNGLSQKLLDKVKPTLAVISAGRDNRYGHPHPEVIKMLEGYKVVGTCEVGDVVVESDGVNWWLN